MRLRTTFLVSMPRSGSTILTNLLDANEGVICPPESFFPAALEWIHAEEMSDRQKIGAIFVVSCSDGSPLTVPEATACVTDDKHETLDNLALAIARKMGRDPEKIQSVVWKFTRMVGSWHFAQRIGGRFIILERNPLNVYESQFRVPFGIKNHSPVRFALFASSYQSAFRKYPTASTLRLDYSNIPKLLASIEDWIGSTGIKRLTSKSALSEIAERNPWHANINKPFEDRDSQKLQNLSHWQIISIRITSIALQWIPLIPILARKIADKRQMQSIRRQAQALTSKESISFSESS